MPEEGYILTRRFRRLDDKSTSVNSYIKAGSSNTNRFVQSSSGEICRDSPVVVELLDMFHLELLGRLLRFRSRRLTVRLLPFLSMSSVKILYSSVLLETSCSRSRSLSERSTMRWLSCGLPFLEDTGDRSGDILWRLLEAGKDVLKTPARDGEGGLLVWDLIWGYGSLVWGRGNRSRSESLLPVSSPVLVDRWSVAGPPLSVLVWLTCWTLPSTSCTVATTLTPPLLWLVSPHSC